MDDDNFYILAIFLKRIFFWYTCFLKLFKAKFLTLIKLIHCVDVDANKTITCDIVADGGSEGLNYLSCTQLTTNACYFDPST